MISLDIRGHLKSGMYRPTFENLKTVLTKLHLKDAARTWRKHCCMMGELDLKRFSKGCSETVIVT